MLSILYVHTACSLKDGAHAAIKWVGGDTRRKLYMNKNTNIDRKLDEIYGKMFAQPAVYKLCLTGVHNRRTP